MVSSVQLTEWFQLKRPMWSDVRIIIVNDIAFIYAKLLMRDADRNIARISLENKKTLDDLNPFEWCK